MRCAQRIGHPKIPRDLCALDRALGAKLPAARAHDGLLPALVTLAGGKTSDMTGPRRMPLRRRDIVVRDNGYGDYGRLALQRRGLALVGGTVAVFFVLVRASRLAERT